MFALILQGSEGAHPVTCFSAARFRPILRLKIWSSVLVLTCIKHQIDKEVRTQTPL